MGHALRIKGLAFMNPCPHPIKTQGNELDPILTGTLGDIILNVENMRAGEQDQASAFGGELRDQENTHICQANRTRKGRENQEDNQTNSRLERD